MKGLLKNCLLQNKLISNKINSLFFLLFAVSIFSFKMECQTTNYVSNGSFEKTYTCTTTNFSLKNLIGWNSLDSVNNAPAAAYVNYCNTNGCCSVPFNSFGYQFPRNGAGFVRGQFYCPNPNICGSAPRGFLKNRLKHKLDSGKTYCSRMFVNSIHSCMYSIDGIAMYYGGIDLDTISTPNNAIPNIIPQVQISYILFDTLNWASISGTFVATGHEKYLVIGCFKADAVVNYSVTNTNTVFAGWAGYNIDDVSCIELNLPAFAGRDTSIFLGDSVFLGRQPDVGIDEACKWYKLPTIITPTTPAIDTVAGFWVNPITTSTYVVRQEICGLVKWDTVVVYMDAVGIEKFNLIKNDLKLFPNPAQDILQIQFTVDVENEFKTISIYNKLGQLLREEDLIFKNKTASIKTEELENGVYVLKLHGKSLQTVSRRFIINR